MAVYSIRYPSGFRFSLPGLLLVVFYEGLGAMPVVRCENRVIVLDPRAVIERNGKVVYRPRDFLDDLHPEMQKWLRENPGWAS